MCDGALEEICVVGAREGSSTQISSVYDAAFTFSYPTTQLPSSQAEEQVQGFWISDLVVGYTEHCALGKIVTSRTCVTPKLMEHVLQQCLVSMKETWTRPVREAQNVVRLTS